MRLSVTLRSFITCQHSSNDFLFFLPQAGAGISEQLERTLSFLYGHNKASREPTNTSARVHIKRLKCTRKTLQKLTLPLSDSEEKGKKCVRTKIAGFTVTGSQAETC